MWKNDTIALVPQSVAIEPGRSRIFETVVHVPRIPVNAFACVASCAVQFGRTVALAGPAVTVSRAVAGAHTDLVAPDANSAFTFRRIAGTSTRCLVARSPVWIGCNAAENNQETTKH